MHKHNNNMKSFLYIYDPNNFKGSILNTMDLVSNEEINQTPVHYSGGTFEQYNAANGCNLVAQPWEVFYPILDSYEKQRFSKPFTEVTEEQYYDGLECLPPCKWHDLNERFNSFYISEALTSHYHCFYIKDRETGKYYSATRSKFIKDEELLSELINF